MDEEENVQKEDGEVQRQRTCHHSCTWNPNGAADYRSTLNCPAPHLCAGPQIWFLPSCWVLGCKFSSSYRRAYEPEGAIQVWGVRGGVIPAVSGWELFSGLEGTRPSRNPGAFTRAGIYHQGGIHQALPWHTGALEKILGEFCETDSIHQFLIKFSPDLPRQP